MDSEDNFILEKRDISYLPCPLLAPTHKITVWEHVLKKKNPSLLDFKHCRARDGKDKITEETAPHWQPW